MAEGMVGRIFLFLFPVSLDTQAHLLGQFILRDALALGRRGLLFALRT